MSENVVAIFAHPDDEVLACGGALAHHVACGDKVSVLILGTGLSSRLNTNEKLNFKKLQEDSRAALSSLGIRDIFFDTFPDNQFDSLPLLNVVQAIEAYVRDKNISHVYTHFYGDLNVDHQIVAKAVMTAFRPCSISGSLTIMCGEVNSSTEWGQSLCEPFNPNYFLNIENYIDFKVRALECYTSEIRSWPHPRSREGLYTLAKYRGMQSGMEFAEAFMVLLDIKK